MDVIDRLWKADILGMENPVKNKHGAGIEDDPQANTVKRPIKDRQAITHDHQAGRWEARFSPAQA